MTILIFAALASSLSNSTGQISVEIVYLPEGRHEITATVDGNQPPAMSKLIFAALAISAAAENAETEAVKAIEKLKSDHQSVSAKATTLEEEIKGLKAKVEADEAEAKKTRKERAETLVKAAAADGSIAPKDEDKQTKFCDKIEAGDTFAEEILAQRFRPTLHLPLLVFFAFP